MKAISLITLLISTLATLTTSLPTKDNSEHSLTTDLDIQHGLETLYPMPLSSANSSLSSRSTYAFLPLLDVAFHNYGYEVPLDSKIRPISSMICVDAQAVPGNINYCADATVQRVGDVMSPSICCQLIWNQCLNTGNVDSNKAPFNVRPVQKLDLVRCTIKDTHNRCPKWPDTIIHNGCGPVSSDPENQWG